MDSGTGDRRRLRWEEVDPWGTPVRCTEDVWEAKIARHPELIAHEAEIRATVSQPHWVFIDTAGRPRPSGLPRAVILHYYGVGRTHGRQEGNYLAVIVKRLAAAGGSDAEAYLESAYTTNRVLPRLVRIESDRGQALT
jgi:hypothetical protein